MLPEKILVLTIPVSPYWARGENKPRTSRRIRPKDALNLKLVAEEMKQSRITPHPLDVDGKPWSVVSVYSPYSPDVHVMVIETSLDRYLPGPERVLDDEEGNHLMRLWATILDFIAQRQTTDTIHVGYNWSPQSWGQEEEKTGLQSIPTKWHAMLWGWPRFPKVGKATEYAKWIDTKQLKPEEGRFLGDNDYAEPFGQLIKNRLKQSFGKNSLLNQLFNFRQWKTDERGICVGFNGSIQDVLRTHRFFSQVMRPIAKELEKIMRQLTEAMTTLDCSGIDKILVKTEKGPLSDQYLRILRTTPEMRTEKDISRTVKKGGGPKSLIDAIREPINARCNELENHLFDFQPAYNRHLDNGKVKNELRKIFKEHGYYLSSKSQIVFKSAFHYEIQDGHKAYFINLKGKKLSVYDKSNWWRKGFGYALVLTNFLKQQRSELRITPGVFVGPGGVVEAQGVILRRPEDKQISSDKSKEKSRLLWQLADILKNKFPAFGKHPGQSHI